mmetsp:Transcript_64429/g.199551  ORF Transcript_64429/g.199551 Transcript_64429/m.199551 type:complete len:248 (+) Transcript_64429:769-1512(+)
MTVGIHGGLWKMTASKKPRKQAANSMTKMKAIRMAILRHHWMRERCTTTWKCVPKPGCWRSMCCCCTKLPPSELSSLLLPDSSESDCQVPVFARDFLNCSRYSRNSWHVITSGFSSCVTCTMSSSTMSSGMPSPSTPRHSWRNFTTPFALSGSPSGANLHQYSSMFWRTTSKQSPSSARRPRVAILRSWMVWADCEPVVCQASKRAPGSVFVGIRGLSTGRFWPERMSIIQSAGFSFAGIWKPRPSK